MLIQSREQIVFILLGSTGRLGQLVAERLVSRVTGTLVLTGRNQAVLESIARRIASLSTTVVVKTQKVRGADDLARLPQGQRTVVLNCLGPAVFDVMLDQFDEFEPLTVVDINEAGSYPEGAVERFSSKHEWIFGCGFNPGLPGVMARWALSDLTDVQRGIIAVAYSDPDITATGLDDILVHLKHDALKYKDGRWQKAGMRPAKQDYTWLREFPHGPYFAIYLEECVQLTGLSGISSLSIYIGGFNKRFFALLGLAKLMGAHKRTSVRQFFRKRIERNIKRSTERYSYLHGAFQTASGRRDLILKCEDVYVATAAIQASVGYLCIEREAAPAVRETMGNVIGAQRLLQLLSGTTDINIEGL